MSDPQPVLPLPAWQTVALGPAIVDLNLLLVGSLATATRRQHEQQLLAEYHALLTERGVGGLSLGGMVDDYRLATRWHLATIVTWLATVDRATLTGREGLIVERLTTDPRVFQAAVDHAG